MTPEKSVAFYDSGIGGLPYLDGFLDRVSPDSPTNVSYFADFAFFPYGEKSVPIVRERILSMISFLIHTENPDLIVLACNTASVVALDALRHRYPTRPFVGVVPAVKPAAAATRSGRLLVLSTSRTAHDPYTDGLVNRFAPHLTVDRLGMPGLVEIVEGSFCHPERTDRIRNAIRSDLLPKMHPDTDVVVLACTHFLHAKKILQDELPPSVTVIDSLNGVVGQTLRLAGLPGNPTGAAVGRGGRAAQSGERPRFWFTGPFLDFRSCLKNGFDVREVHS